MHTRANDVAAWLRERATEAGARGFLVGLSGGVASAVVGRLCQMAAPTQIIGMILPCTSDVREEADARLAADHFRIPTVRVDLSPVCERLTADLGPHLAALLGAQQLLGASRKGAFDAEEDRPDVSPANLRARLRMTALYFAANSLDYLVAGTCNRAELAVGYFTKYGDGAADVMPLGNMLTHDVLAMARDLGVPGSLLDTLPGVGRWPGERAEPQFGFTYAELERYLADGPEAVAPALALRIERLMRRSEHKRVGAPTPASDVRIRDF